MAMAAVKPSEEPRANHIDVCWSCWERGLDSVHCGGSSSLRMGVVLTVPEKGSCSSSNISLPVSTSSRLASENIFSIAYDPVAQKATARCSTGSSRFGMLLSKRFDERARTRGRKATGELRLGRTRSHRLGMRLF